MKIVSTGNSEHYHWSDKCDGWHLLKSTTLSVIQERVPPGSSEVRHLHEKAEQFFYILSGIATLEADGEVHQINANQGIHIPAGKLHQLKNASDTELIFLVISSPPSHGDRIEK